MQPIVTGAWRNNLPHDPMQVVSGAMGKEKVHYEALLLHCCPMKCNSSLSGSIQTFKHPPF